MLVKKGSFNAPTSTGNSAVTGVGFTPKAIIFWATLNTAAGYANGMSFAIGLVTGTANRKTMAVASDDSAGVANSNTGSRYANLALSVLSNGTPTVGAEADLASLDADGFTLNWTTAAAGKDYVVHYLALGGAGLTNAKASSFTGQAGSGAQAVTGVGFQPDCIILLSDFKTATGNSADAQLGIGMGTSSSRRGTTGIGDRDAQSTTTGGVTQSLVQVMRTLAFGSLNGAEGDLTSLDADGFTITWGTPDVQEIPYLALKGGSYFVGSDVQLSGTGTQAKTGVGFTPKALFMTSFGRTASLTTDANLAKISVGASDGTTEGCTWVESADNVTTPNAESATVTTKAIRMAALNSTTVAEANVSAFGSDGYTLNWTTADSGAGALRQFLFLAVGGAEAPVNTVAPAVTGTAKVGSVLTTTTGTWTGDATISYTYQWQRGGSNIGSATSSTYTLVDADDATNVRCVVTATNSAGAVSANSNAVAITEPVPTVSVAPAVTGTTALGDTLTCGTGTWLNMGGSIHTYAYQWKRDGVNIAGQTASTHVIVSADQGTSLTCAVTATNTGGASSASTSSGTAIPAAVVASAGGNNQALLGYLFTHRGRR